MQILEYSDAGLAMTRSFEGLRLEAYQDSGGVWTIGYGHTGSDVHAGQRVTEFEAEALLRADVRSAVSSVQRAVTAQLSQNQFDALVDFCFNVGCGNFERSSLLKYVNLGDFASAAVQFMLWVNIKGQRSSGLVRRREAECAMFTGAPEMQSVH